MSKRRTSSVDLARSTAIALDAADKNVSSCTYMELAERVVNYHYTNGLAAPIQYQIALTIKEIKNVRVETYSTSSIQGSLSRILRKLVEKNKVVKTETKGYIPYNHETRRNLLRPQIVKSIKFGPKPIFAISSKTWLIDIELESLAIAKKFFSLYLGPNCYDVLRSQGYLMVLFSGKKETVDYLKSEIKDMRAEALKLNKEALDQEMKHVIRE